MKADLIYEIKNALISLLCPHCSFKNKFKLHSAFFLLLIQLNLTLGIFMFSTEIILFKNGNLNIMMMMIRTQINKKKVVKAETKIFALN